MKDALFKIDEFCKANRIEYIVTGTMALYLLGVPSRYIPQDIDIKVFNLTGEQVKMLKQLQFLSGLNNSNYEDGECYSFIVNGVKINAIVGLAKFEEQYVSLNFAGNIDVQLVKGALIDKMKLKREKDKDYLIDLVGNLTSLI
jgi:hypothetical protein